MHRSLLAFYLTILSLPLCSQAPTVEDGVHLVQKLMNNAEIRRHMPDPLASASYEFRVYMPKYDYSKPIKKRLIQVIPETGETRLYLFDSSANTVTPIMLAFKQSNRFLIEFDDTSWYFHSALAVAHVTVS